MSFCAVDSLLRENPWLFSDVPGIYVIEGDLSEYTIPSMGTIRDLVEDRFLDAFREPLRAGIEAGSLWIGRRSSKVPVPNRRVVRRCYIHRVDAYETDKPAIGSYAIGTMPGNMANILRLEVVLCADIDLENTYSGSWDSVRQYFRVTAHFDTLNNRVFVDGGISIYNSRKKLAGRRLDEHLVPLLCEVDMEAEATRLLGQLFPNWSSDRMRITGEVLADCLGLRIVELPLPDNEKARLYPDGGTARLKGKDGIYQNFPIDPGTIVLREGLSHWNRNWAVTHECVHFLEHRHFFRLQKAYHENISYFGEFMANDTPEGEKSTVDWMEWQANLITGQILMAKMDCYSFISQEASGMRLTDINELAVFEKIAWSLARHFSVSREAARIRMVELGYRIADGIFIHIDGRYIPSFCCSLEYRLSGGKYRPRDFVISLDDVIELYHENKRLQEDLKKGRFLYLEGHLCLDRPEYIQRTSGEIRLTDYARTHIEECCLLFSRKRTGSRDYDAGVFHHESAGIPCRAVYRGTVAGLPLDEIEIEMSEYEQIMSDISLLDFGGTLQYHMTKTSVTIQRMADEIKKSTDSVKRYRKKGYTGKIEYETVLAMCFVLNLKEEFTEDLLRKRGLCIDAGTDAGRCHRYMVRYMSDNRLTDINDFMSRKGLPRLT